WRSRRKAATNAAGSARRCSAPTERTPQPASPGCPAPMAFQLPPQAERSLLCRLTGETDFNREVAAQQCRSIAKPPRESGAPATAGPRTPRDWLNGVTRRAEKAWQDSLERCHMASDAAVDNTPLRVSPSLATEWSRPFNGQAVSMELLAQLAKLALPGGAHAQRDANHSTEQPIAAGNQALSSPTAALRSHETGRQDDGLSQEARSRWAAGHSSAVSAPATASSVVRATDIWQTLAREPVVTTPPARLDLSLSNDSDSEREEVEWPPPARIAPPATAPSPAPLLPPQMPGAIAPPVAAAT